jgi:cytidine deaminase
VSDPRHDAWVEAATNARKNSMCSYSGFAVGAVIEDAGGRLWGGCNVENATYGLTVCAERVAIWKAISEGIRQFRGVAVVTGAPEPTPPCGACRQILWEFAGDVPIVMATTSGSRKTMRLSELLPLPFELEGRA